MFIKIFGKLKNDEMTLKFPINKYLIGTQKDVYENCKQLEDIWAAPLNLFEVKPSKKSKSLSLKGKSSYKQVAIGALIYADLMKNRTSNYVFDIDNASETWNYASMD
mgnify:CR=1 FL=1